MKCEFSNSNKFIFINDGAIFSFLILVEVVLLTDIVKYRPSLSQTAQENTFLRACLHGGGGPQVGEVTRLGGVTRLSI